MKPWKSPDNVWNFNLIIQGSEFYIYIRVKSGKEKAVIFAFHIKNAPDFPHKTKKLKNALFHGRFMVIRRNN